MIITSSLLEDLRKSFVTLFKKGLANSSSQWKKVATRVPSSTKENTYGWLGKFPSLREWVGDRVLKSMKEHGYTLPNKKFESTVDVDRADIEDDNLGVYNVIAESAGQEAEDHIDRNVFAVLADGFNNLCYDGQNFFDEEHPVYPEADGTGVVVPTSNILNPLITDKPAWFLLDCSRPLKPLIFQERTPAEMDAITDPKNDTVFMKDVYLYGVRARRAFGVGFWQQAVGCRDTLSEANFNAAYKMMMDFKKDGGDKLGIRPTILVVNSDNVATANELINAMTKANGASNPLYKRVEVLECTWY